MVCEIRTLKNLINNVYMSQMDNKNRKMELMIIAYTHFCVYLHSRAHLFISLLNVDGSFKVFTSRSLRILLIKSLATWSTCVTWGLIVLGCIIC